MANPEWLNTLLKAVLAFKPPQRTFCGVFLTDISSKVDNFEMISANFTASGIEAVFADKKDGQTYHLTIEAMKA